MKSKRKREESPPLHLSDDDDPYDEREEDMRIGKKRVGDVSCYQVFKESRIYRMMLDKGCLSSVLVFNINYDMCACSLSISVPLSGLFPDLQTFPNVASSAFHSFGSHTQQRGALSNNSDLAVLNDVGSV